MIGIIDCVTNECVNPCKDGSFSILDRLAMLINSKSPSLAIAKKKGLVMFTMHVHSLKRGDRTH